WQVAEPPNHRFSVDEVVAAIGMDTVDRSAALKRLQLRQQIKRSPDTRGTIEGFTSYVCSFILKGAAHVAESSDHHRLQPRRVRPGSAGGRWKMDRSGL